MIGFVLIGGEHQLLHIVPVAAAMSRSNSVPVELFAATPRLAAAAAELMRRLNAGAYGLTVLGLPAGLEALSRDTTLGNLKLLRLLRHMRRLRNCSALVSAERTSSMLKRWPGRCPPMIHLRHGAGDRAVGFEQRIALFDEVIVAGTKDRRRTIESGLVAPAHCHACGYIKLSVLPQLRGSVRPLFSNGRPTVLYNPHFRAGLSSWQRDGLEVVRTIQGSGQFNLIVAPHVRLFAAASRAERAGIESLAKPDEVVIDLGSTRSLDMTYTLAADMYLGDVSSQIYEFTAEPRPCVFLDSHAAAWRGNPDYLMWEMGEVVTSPASVVPALRRAGDMHGSYRDLQQRLTSEALGEMGPECADRAAQVIERVALAKGLGKTSP